MSIGAIVVIVVVGLLFAFLVSVRIEVAKQRRAVETTRARLAAAKVRRRSEGVTVEAILQAGQSIAHVPRKSTCALADDGLYCLSEDGRWGARVRFGAAAPGIGDVALSAPPALVRGGKVTGNAAADVPAWLATGLTSLPPDGILLQFQVGLSWLVAVPEPDAWFAALTEAVGAPGAAATG